MRSLDLLIVLIAPRHLSGRACSQLLGDDVHGGLAPVNVGLCLLQECTATEAYPSVLWRMHIANSWIVARACAGVWTPHTRFPLANATQSQK